MRKIIITIIPKFVYLVSLWTQKYRRMIKATHNRSSHRALELSCVQEFTVKLPTSFMIWQAWLLLHYKCVVVGKNSGLYNFSDLVLSSTSSTSEAAFFLLAKFKAKNKRFWRFSVCRSAENNNSNLQIRTFSFHHVAKNLKGWLKINTLFLA
jgi:hypothetical protein